MACGLQNAMATAYSGRLNHFIALFYVFLLFLFFIITIPYMNSVIRTTHVTGTFTDIGIILGRRVKGNSVDLWKLKILIPLAFGK